MIGERIRTLREKIGMSQEELAHSVGMHPNTVARWERGELIPRGTSLSKLARGLNTTSTYLLSETDDPLPQNAHSQPEPPAEERSVVEKSNSRKLTYTFENGEKLELPDTDRGYALFEKILARKAVMA